MRIDGDGYRVDTDPLADLQDDWELDLALEETPVPSRDGQPKPDILKD